MSNKHFIPIEMDGKMVLVKNAPEEKDFEDDGRDFYIMRYEAAIEACPKLPTLPEHFAYWKSKEGVKMNYVVEDKDGFVIPPPTLSELQPKPMVTEAFNDDGTHSHYRLLDPRTGDLLWTQDPEEDTHLWTGKVPYPTYAIPKPDDKDVWEEEIKKIIAQVAFEVNKKGVSGYSSSIDFANKWWSENKQRYMPTKK